MLPIYPSAVATKSTYPAAPEYVYLNSVVPTSVPSIVACFSLYDPIVISHEPLTGILTTAPVLNCAQSLLVESNLPVVASITKPLTSPVVP